MRILMEGRNLPGKMYETTLANGDHLELSFSNPVIIALDFIMVSNGCPCLSTVAYWPIVIAISQEVKDFSGWKHRTKREIELAKWLDSVPGNQGTEPWLDKT